MRIAPKIASLALAAMSLGSSFPAAPPAPAAPSPDGWTPLHYSADNPALLENPLKGLFPWARRADSFPHSMEWFYLRLSDVMKGENQFDWEPLENQLRPIAARGNQAVFRFYVDYPNHPTALPQYLLDAGVKTFPYTDSNNTLSVSPDYSDPRVIHAFTSFVAAFGKKYDNDPRIAFLQAGLYGFWGEWHVHDHPKPGEPAGWRISPQDNDAILAAYLKAFPHTLVQVRYATSTADPALQRAFGYHDDSIGRDTVGAKPSFFWNRIRAAHLDDIWQTRPIGGEMYPALNKTLWDLYPRSDDQNVEEDIRTTHMSWMSNNNAFSPTLTPAQRARALAAHRLMGYELFVAAAKTAPAPGGKTTLTLQLENRGIAPFYYDWKVEVAYASPDQGILAATPVGWKLTTLLPGKPLQWQTELPRPPAGATAIVMRAVNPLKNGKPLCFANREWEQTTAGWLTLKQSSEF
jgi:hypothetical protein